MRTNGKTALVLGITGGVGGETAAALLARGWAVRGLVRDHASVASSWRGRQGMPEWRQGDAMMRDDVVRAARGVDVIVHAVNPPGYRHWDKLVLPMVANTIAAAKAAGGARVVLPGTIYNYDPAATPVIDADTLQQPRTRKGAIRVALERQLEAVSADVPSLIVRAGDFFGPRSRASWFAQAMVRPGKPLTHIIHPGRGVGHAWAYLPDLADTIACLVDDGENLARFERVQFEGFWDPTGAEMTAAIRRVVGGHVPERRFPWWLMRLAAPFGGFPREAVEIEGFWRNPVRLDNRRLVQLLGREPRTPIDQAVAVTLAGLGCLPKRVPALRPQTA